jgi:hypothetical protein
MRRRLFTVASAISPSRSDVKKRAKPTRLAAVVLLVTIFGCDRVPKERPSDPVPLLISKLEDRARGAEGHGCGPEAAVQLRSVAQRLAQGGLKSFDGQCTAFCAFVAVHTEYDPTDASLILIQAVTSSSFKYAAVELINADGAVVGYAGPTPLIENVAHGVDAVKWFSASFYLQDKSGDGASTRSFSGVPVVRLERSVMDLRVRLRAAGGATSNAVPLLQAASKGK